MTVPGIDGRGASFEELIGVRSSSCCMSVGMQRDRIIERLRQNLPVYFKIRQVKFVDGEARCR